MHILLIEDHERVAQNIQTFLQSQGYAVHISHNGREGLTLASTMAIDLLILDINLPEVNGFTICNTLREEGKAMPILMLTARDTNAEVAQGLNIGADDYLIKPFDLDVLLARVRALLRRKGEGVGNPLLKSGNITLNSNTREVVKGKKRVDLSPKEYALLEFLLLHKGVAQRRTSILEHVWGDRDDLMYSNTVDVHVTHLRRKLGKSVIRTVPNIGYMIPKETS